MSAERLRDELAAAAGAVTWPPTPDIAAAVTERLGERDAPAPAARRPTRRRVPDRGWRTWPAAATEWSALRLAATVAALLLLVVAAVPPARSAVLDVLGLTRGEKITRVDQAPLPAQTRRFELGLPTSLDAAQRAVSFDVRTPATLGSPDAVRLTRAIPGGMVSLVYGERAVLSQFRGGATPYIQKLAGPGARVQPVRVEGATGYFVSGAPAAVLVRGSDGSVIEGRAVLDGASVLVWDHGAVAQRLELRGSLAQALEIANSLR